MNAVPKNWSVADIPPQTGKLAVITGATGGLGYETALALAGAGAEVVLTGRNADKGAEALERIRAAHPDARVGYEQLDLASLRSVEAFAGRFAATRDHLDILVNNAGVMALPRRQLSADGYELQLATNYLGHFALTARLLAQLRAAPAGRIVSLSSIAARRGAIRFDDLQSERHYSAWRAYSQTKLACLMFGLELARRSAEGGWGVASMIAHPGVASTALIANGPGSGGTVNAMVSSLLSSLVMPMLSQSPAAGALPQLFAATAPQAQSGAYYGPTGPGEMRGAPGLATPPSQATNRADAARLWRLSEDLTGVAFPGFAAAA